MRKHLSVRAIRHLFSWNPRSNPAGYLLLFAALFYLAVLAAPDFLFAETVHAGAITIHTHIPSASILPDVQRAEARLALSSINDIAAPQHVYLTRSNSEFRFFALRAYRALGITYSAFSSIYVPPSDVVADMVTSARSQFNQVPLSAVLAHERMHILLSHHFGYFAIFMSPAWKQEGYCDYIAGSHSIGDDAAGLKLLRQGTLHDPALDYFRDYLRVKYLIEQRHLSVDQVFDGSFDTAVLDREIMVMANGK